MENKDLPAFASTALSEHNSYHQEGLTKREHFAGLALLGIDKKDYKVRFGSNWAEIAATDAVKLADALLIELEKKN